VARTLLEVLRHFACRERLVKRGKPHNQAAWAHQVLLTIPLPL
jgi:hypothetical protein